MEQRRIAGSRKTRLRRMGRSAVRRVQCSRAWAAAAGSCISTDPTRHIRGCYPKVEDKVIVAKGGPEGIPQSAAARRWSTTPGKYDKAIRVSVRCATDVHPEALNPFYQGMENMNFNADLYRWMLAAPMHRPGRASATRRPSIFCGHSEMQPSTWRWTATSIRSPAAGRRATATPRTPSAS